MRSLLLVGLGVLALLCVVTVGVVVRVLRRRQAPPTLKDRTDTFRGGHP